MSTSTLPWRLTLALPSAFRPGLSLAWLFVIGLLIAALVPHWLTGTDPLAAAARNAYLPPAAATGWAPMKTVVMYSPG
ncbi:hypothetical protein NHF39_22085 [Pseudomonas proteolytica]|nr:hypothetical protein [Pseudomonas proteolytica]USW94027.1 hypothetical protein NHF39_22085 [Pseudomonas proteolytica]USX02012.1 hypothetical protein NHF41_09440 [Pseudomonas proteolytica]